MKTTPSNYIDLEPKVSDYYGTSPGQERRAGICDALRYLDSHPERVPGWTMTQSEFYSIADDSYDEDRTRYQNDRDLLSRFGITVIPEPTNAEKLAIYLGLHDLDAITNDGVAEFARQLDADGVKAPGDDDE